uniref:Uncharacterized protein n=1 Tax=Tanacetum cinerariifolium TaxID=118510 RepID=A0A6L2ND00_TANCI|nr:hypothetical protein [Tanacetum cinerariifolium]
MGKRAKEVRTSAPNLAATYTTFEVNHDEGFIKVNGRKNKGKKTDAQPKLRPIGAVRLNKPKPNFHPPIVKTVATDPTKASSSKPNENKAASPSCAKYGVTSTPMSKSFDVLNNLTEEEDEVQAKSNLNEPSNSNQQPPAKEENVASTSNPVLSIRDFECGELGESDDDEVFKPGDVLARYISSTGGRRKIA